MSTTLPPTATSHTWQTVAIDHLSHLFEQEPEVSAFILTGSLADDDIQADFWSDVDVKVVLADHAMDRYFASTTWLESFGHVIGLETHENPRIKTLRVCLASFHRFDFVFVAETALQEGYRFQQPCKVLWTKLPDLETYIAPQPAPPKPQPVTSADIGDAGVARMADAFWFKATAAVGKVARNDLLIAAHLALDLARDCLVLQMMRRDREKGTPIHRTGGWGNEVVGDLFGNWGNADKTSALRVLDLIEWSCDTFDALAADLSPDYTPRAPALLPTLDYAKRTLCV